MVKWNHNMISMDSSADQITEKLKVSGIRLVGSDGANVAVTDLKGNNRVSFAGDDAVYFSHTWFDGLKFSGDPVGTLEIYIE